MTEDRTTEGTCTPDGAADRAELLADEGFMQAAQTALEIVGACFLQQPDEPLAERAIALIRGMDIAADWPFGSDEHRVRAAGLAAQGASEDARTLRAEFTRMFRGPAALPAPPWGSVYMDRDQVRYGCTWLELRSWMREHAISSLYGEKEPEDQFGRLMMLCAEVARSRPDLFCELLETHVLTWADHYLDLFDGSVASPTYAAAGVLARASLSDMRSLLGLKPARRRFYR